MFARWRQSHHRGLGWVCALSLIVLLGCGKTEVPDHEVRLPGIEPGKPAVGFVGTHEKIVDKMVEMAELKPTDVVYDLGCGDARILIAAAKKHGVKCVGIELDPEVVKLAEETVKKEGVEELVTIRHADIFESDFSDADVVMLYLFPELNVRLMPKLAQLKPGSRIISHSFDMKGARPAKIETVFGKKIYLWRVPWRPE